MPLANAQAATIPKIDDFLLQLTIWLVVDEALLRHKLVRVGNEVCVPNLDHRTYADGNIPRDHELDLTVLTLVD